MHKSIRNVTIAALGAVLLNGTVWAEEDTYGWVEMAAVEPGWVEAKAKLDSGALTSSIHAEDIERFERDDEDWVRFTLSLEDEESEEEVTEQVEKPVYRNLTVRGAGGTEERPVVLMKLCMGETIYEEQFSLNDRSDMIYPILLGRRTIQHLGEIDVTSTFLHDPECSDESPVMAHDEQDSDEDIGT